jgi:glutaredoxin-like protein
MAEMLDSNTMKKVQEILSKMNNPVKLVVFKSESHPPGVALAQLASELANANPLLSAEIHDFDSERKLAEEYGVSQPSTLCVIGKEKRYIHVLGLPSGHEFLPFLQTLLEVSKGSAEIPRDIEAKIKAIDFPVTMKVFITPTCPYCPPAVRLAHIMALANPNVRSEMVEATEFPELSQKYEVSGVPKTVINDIIDLVGAHPPEIVLKKINELK